MPLQPTGKLNFFSDLPRQKADRYFAILLSGVVLLEAAVLALMPLSLAPDEAYYWEWSRRLDVAYFDKGPIVPLIIRFFCSILGDTAFAVRIGALLCQALFSTLLYQYVRRVYSAGLGLLCVIILWSSLIFASQGLFMTNDPPLSILYLLAVCFAADTVRSGDSRGWIKTFVVLGLAVVCKYTAVLLYPGIFAFLALTPRQRFHLQRPAFWIGSGLIVVTLLPMILWNFSHGWPQLGHNVHHLAASEGSFLRPRKLFELVGGQWGLLGALIFPLLCFSLFRAVRLWRRGDDIAGLYAASALPLAAVCLAVSLRKSCYANWPMPVYIGAILAFAHLVHQAREIDPKAVLGRQITWIGSKLRVALVINCCFLLACHLLLTGESFGIPRERLPTKRLIGWENFAKQVEPVLRSHRRCWIRRNTKKCITPAIIAENYQIGSELAFYLPDHPRVFIESDRRTRRNQYDLWGGWESLKGRDALIILEDPAELANFASKFQSVEPVEQLPFIDRVYDNELFVRSYLYIGRSYDGSQG